MRGVGLVGLWLLFALGLVSWWLLMATLFQRGSYLEAILIAYAMPSLYALSAFLVPRLTNPVIKPLHFWLLAAATVIHTLLWLSLGAPLPSEGVGAYLGLGLIATVMTLMQYPMAGLERYGAYRRPVFLSGVIFMALFVYIAAMMPYVPLSAKVYLFPIGMLGFWLSAAWLAYHACHGLHVPGLELRPLAPFRPDYILPGGVLYVKGVILMGVGMMIATRPELGMPKWNWWGFVLAFWGIITLIPLRGMFKLLRGPRLRLLGLGGTGWGHIFAKEGMLFVGLLILLYGFVNAFFGAIPFSGGAVGFRPDVNAFVSGQPITRIIAITALVLSFLILVPLRGWYKMHLLEGIERPAQAFVKQLLLWFGAVILFAAYLHLFNLPPVRPTGYLWLYLSENPVGVTVGGLLFLAGSLLILALRPIALRNEFEAIMKTMVGLAADQPDNIRHWMLERRMRTLAEMPEAQRYRHVTWMVEGLSHLPTEARERLVATQSEILSELEPDARRRMMAAMDAATMGGL